ncbi:hypothetical protein T03_49 [Trichinella britovi]|uniref:Uncharacterized protein n=1 Tax=Trichinella britovi TaxID=45882 RepID=A0A0V1C4Z7_TRIBR|nr:hypothetical protein T03_49 [Trichinella britovi]
MRARLHGGGSDGAVIFSRLLPTCVVRLGLAFGSPSAARLSSHAVGRCQLLGALHPIRSNFVGCHVGPQTIPHRVPKN